MLADLAYDCVSMSNRDGLTLSDLQEAAGETSDKQVITLKEFYYADEIPEILLKYFDPDYQ